MCERESSRLRRCCVTLGLHCLTALCYQLCFAIRTQKVPLRQTVVLLTRHNTRGWLSYEQKVCKRSQFDADLTLIQIAHRFRSHVDYLPPDWRTFVVRETRISPRSCPRDDTFAANSKRHTLAHCASDMLREVEAITSGNANKRRAETMHSTNVN